MYKIYLDGNLIYSPASDDLVVTDPQMELELNAPGQFTFTIPQLNPYYSSPQKMLSRVKVKRNDETLFYGRIIDESIDFYKNKTLTCEGELAYLNDSIQRPAEYHDMTVKGYLEALIDAHNEQVDTDKQFIVGIVTVEDSNDSLYRYTNYNSTMEELKDDLIDDLGGYLRVRYQDGVRYLDYVKAVDYGNTNDNAIRFGTNLLDFTQDMDVTDIATVIIPLGERLEDSEIEALDMRLTIADVNGGKDWIQSDEAVALYGRIVKTVTWDDVTQADNLMSKGQKYLSDTQWDNVELTANAVDMNLTDAEADAFHLGDQLRVVSDPHGLDRYFPLSKMNVDLANPQNNSYTLGLVTSPSLMGQLITQTDLSNQLGSLNARSSSITNSKIDEAKTSVLDEAIENATIIINNKTTNGHVVLDSPYEEILIMDTDDKDTAQRVWRWNVNGLGYSTTGYSGPYGLAMTMDGSIVADYITTGTLNADLIKTGMIKALNGDNYWDLDNGEMKVGGWDVGSKSLYNNTDSMTSTSNGIYMGTDGYRQYSSGNYLNITSTTVENGSNLGSYARLNSASLELAFYGTLLGKFTTSYLSSSDDSMGIAVYTEADCDYISFAHKRSSRGSSYDSSYLISYNDDISEFEHNFTGTVNFSNRIYVNNSDYCIGAFAVNGSIAGLYTDGRILTKANSTTGSYCVTDTSGNIAYGMYMTNANNIRFGDANYETILYGNPVVLSSGTAVTSDRSLKSDIQPLSQKYEDLIDCLTPRVYELDEHPDLKHIGFVVDELEDAMKSAGLNPDDYGLTTSYTEEDGRELGAIRYEEIIPILVYEIQKLKAEIAELKKVT